MIKMNMLEKIEKIREKLLNLELVREQGIRKRRRRKRSKKSLDKSSKIHMTNQV